MYQEKGPPDPSGVRSGPPCAAPRTPCGPVLPRVVPGGGYALGGDGPGGPLVENAKRLPDRVEHRFPDKRASPEHPKRGNFIFINSYAYYIKIESHRPGCFQKSQIASTCRGPVGQPSDLARGSNLLKTVCKEKIRQTPGKAGRGCWIGLANRFSATMGGRDRNPVPDTGLRPNFLGYSRRGVGDLRWPCRGPLALCPAGDRMLKKSLFDAQSRHD